MGNAAFRSRQTDGQKGFCKVLSSSHSMLAFDDNPDDWELIRIDGSKAFHDNKRDSSSVDECNGAAVVRVISPAKAEPGAETDMCGVLKQFISTLGRANSDDDD